MASPRINFDALRRATASTATRAAQERAEPYPYLAETDFFVNPKQLRDYNRNNNTFYKAYSDDNKYLLLVEVYETNRNKKMAVFFRVVKDKEQMELPLIDEMLDLKHDIDDEATLHNAITNMFEASFRGLSVGYNRRLIDEGVKSDYNDIVSVLDEFEFDLPGFATDNFTQAIDNDDIVVQAWDMKEEIDAHMRTVYNTFAMMGISLQAVNVEELFEEPMAEIIADTKGRRKRRIKALEDRITELQRSNRSLRQELAETKRDLTRARSTASCPATAAASRTNSPTRRADEWPA